MEDLSQLQLSEEDIKKVQGMITAEQGINGQTLN